MSLPNQSEFSKPERLTKQVQTKVTPSEYADLEMILAQLSDRGITDVTISSLVRTFIVTGIRAFKAEMADN